MFEIVYTPLEADFGWLSLIADGMNLTEYSYEGKDYCGICRIRTLAAWLKQHKAIFLEDDPFPVTSHGDTGASLWMNSDAYLDGEEFHEKRQAWIWRHSLDSCREEFCLPFVVIRYKDGKIEISWNNHDHNFTGVTFRYPEGVCYVDAEHFEREICKVIGE